MSTTLPGRRGAAPAAGGKQVARAPRWPKNAAAPALVEVRRGPIVESRHRGHLVQVGGDGSIECTVGDATVVVSLRSCVKPFTLVPFIESGAADAFGVTPAELALLASSHSGEDLHVRTLQALFRRANISQSILACGTFGAPLDALTAARLARDGETPGPIRHMCSGYHAASILLSRHKGWTLDDYWKPDHPSQLASRDAVARAFGLRPDRLLTAVDSCGLLTYGFPLVEIARAYALLADPDRNAPDADRRALAPALRRVRDAMASAPEMIGGTRERFGSALMKALPGRVIAKGGAEALEGLALLPGWRGAGSAAGGMVVTIEDGDGRGRAVAPVVLEAFHQLAAVDERELRHLGRWARPALHDPRGEVVGEVVPGFQLAPISELRRRESQA